MDDQVKLLIIAFSIIVGFFIIISLFIVPCNSVITENWVNYKQLPFGNIYSGSDAVCYSKPSVNSPIMNSLISTTKSEKYNLFPSINKLFDPDNSQCLPSFYEVIRYNKPYNYPRTHLIDYPLPHFHHPNP